MRLTKPQAAWLKRHLKAQREVSKWLLGELKKKGAPQKQLARYRAEAKMRAAILKALNEEPNHDH